MLLKPSSPTLCRIPMPRYRIHDTRFIIANAQTPPRGHRVSSPSFTSVPPSPSSILFLPIPGSQRDALDRDRVVNSRTPILRGPLLRLLHRCGRCRSLVTRILPFWSPRARGPSSFGPGRCVRTRCFVRVTCNPDPSISPR